MRHVNQTNYGYEVIVNRVQSVNEIVRIRIVQHVTIYYHDLMHLQLDYDV